MEYLLIRIESFEMCTIYVWITMSC